MTEFKTPAEVAKRWRRKVPVVLTLIARGELQAVNVGTGLAKPRWAIPEDAIKEFEQRRTNRKPEKPAPRRKKRKTDVERFFPETGGR